MEDLYGCCLCSYTRGTTALMVPLISSLGRHVWKSSRNIGEIEVMYADKRLNVATNRRRPPLCVFSRFFCACVASASVRNALLSGRCIDPISSTSACVFAGSKLASSLQVSPCFSSSCSVIIRLRPQRAKKVASIIHPLPSVRPSA